MSASKLDAVYAYTVFGTGSARVLDTGGSIRDATEEELWAIAPKYAEELRRSFVVSDESGES